MDWLTSAAIVAIIVAFFAFPWQRAVEYQFLYRQERRTLYRAFLAQTETVQRLPKAQASVSSEEFLQLERLRIEMSLIATSPVNTAAAALLSQFIYKHTHDNGVADFEGTNRNDEEVFAQSRKKLIKEMRRELRRPILFAPKDETFLGK